MTTSQQSFRNYLVDMRKAGHTEGELMNLLQDHGIISDLCLEWTDIAEADQMRAVAFLTNYFEQLVDWRLC